jgi:hypothetical protein
VLELSIELFVPNFICITAINLHSSVCYLSFALHLPPIIFRTSKVSPY